MREDAFIAATRGSEELGSDDFNSDDLIAECSSPELMAGAAFFLSSCLQSMRARDGVAAAEEDARTQQLIQSALQLVEQAGALSAGNSHSH